MPELGTFGSARGVPGNECPHRNPRSIAGPPDSDCVTRNLSFASADPTADARVRRDPASSSRSQASGYGGGTLVCMAVSSHQQIVQWVADTPAGDRQYVRVDHGPADVAMWRVASVRLAGLVLARSIRHFGGRPSRGSCLHLETGSERSS
jgi:hypothetical protein